MNLLDFFFLNHRLQNAELGFFDAEGDKVSTFVPLHQPPLVTDRQEASRCERDLNHFAMSLGQPGARCTTPRQELA